jgi:hypothetical protein
MARKLLKPVTWTANLDHPIAFQTWSSGIKIYTKPIPTITNPMTRSVRNRDEEEEEEEAAMVVAPPVYCAVSGAEVVAERVAVEVVVAELSPSMMRLPNDILEVGVEGSASDVVALIMDE